jgi:SNF2 family DNA or RNA helicase
VAVAEVHVAGDGRGLELVASHGTVADVERHLRDHGVTIRRRRVGQRLRVDFAAGSQLLRSGLSDIEWSAEACRALNNRERVHDAAPAVLAEVRRIQDEGAEAARAMLGDGGLIEFLDDHQAINVAVMTTPGGWGACIFDEQGTGKTLTVIAAFDVLVERNETDVLLVVAPKSMVAEWAVEFGQFTGDMYTVAVAQGSRRDKAQALSIGADVVVLNYESAVTLSDDLRLLTRRARVTLVIDESFNVKNPDARRTAALTALRESCARCFVLCGTPAPNAPDDLRAQFDVVDFGFTFDRFRPSADAAADRERMRGAMDARGVYTRNLKSVVLPDLPTRRFTEIEVDLAPVQAAMYSTAVNGLVTDLRSASDEEFERDLTSFLARRNALLRICSNPAPLVDSYDETPAKLAALDDLLPQYVYAGEKVIIWSFYRASLDALAARYDHLGLVRVDGGVSDVSTRRDAVRRFQHDDETRIFLGNPAAAGAGLTLHRARLAVYESMSNQAAHFMQSLDRIHRRGQARDVEYVVLLCSQTIEEREYRRLLDKADAQADVLGDPEPERPTRQMMLTELLAAQKSPPAA